MKPFVSKIELANRLGITIADVDTLIKLGAIPDPVDYLTIERWDFELVRDRMRSAGYP